MVGAGHAWHQCSFATAQFIGGFTIVASSNGPATGGSPVTSWMLALWMGVHIFESGKYWSQKEG